MFTPSVIVIVIVKFVSKEVLVGGVIVRVCPETVIHVYNPVIVIVTVPPSGSTVPIVYVDVI
jgi:hypothetical protein